MFTKQEFAEFYDANEDFLLDMYDGDKENVGELVIKIVDEYRDGPDYDSLQKVYELEHKDGQKQWFRQHGEYSSWEGTRMFREFNEVERVEKTITVWKDKK